MLIKETVVMRIGKTANGHKLGELVMVKHLDKIKDTPIVYNKDQKFKNYNQDLQENYFSKLPIIGYVVGDARIIGRKVVADVEIDDQYANLWKGCSNNWLISLELDDDKRVTDIHEILSFEVF